MDYNHIIYHTDLEQKFCLIFTKSAYYYPDITVELYS